jgi:hypothetical protein
MSKTVKGKFSITQDPYDSDLEFEVKDTKPPEFMCDAMYDIYGKKLPFCFEFDFSGVCGLPVHDQVGYDCAENEQEEEYTYENENDNNDSLAQSDAVIEASNPTLPGTSDSVQISGQAFDQSAKTRRQRDRQDEIVHRDFVTRRDVEKVKMFGWNSSHESTRDVSTHESEDIYRICLVVF